MKNWMFYSDVELGGNIFLKKQILQADERRFL